MEFPKALLKFFSGTLSKYLRSTKRLMDGVYRRATWTKRYLGKNTTER